MIREKVYLDNKEVVYIRKVLLEKGIRPIDLARKLGVNTSTIYKILNGSTRSKRIALAIEDYLGVPNLFPYAHQDTSSSFDNKNTEQNLTKTLKNTNNSQEKTENLIANKN
ncbi:Helix-turn-helix [Persephonella hydrogeniphila]|uniref:Helix-turn-helix n=1 Tax=Persephonella hydrogeniphila TaxID=198703 RepID=A0A285NFG4_9AQUI|nr:helix-turn-helix transcriptional regulator [Persephonella hydrogeniphila]SNZ07707.1 Helix-turn-helix [Persephonella hydrogeniphila]